MITFLPTSPFTTYVVRDGSTVARLQKRKRVWYLDRDGKPGRPVGETRGEAYAAARREHGAQSLQAASDALVDAVTDGFTFREILELAMNDVGEGSVAAEYLGRVHDVYTAGEREEG